MEPTPGGLVAWAAVVVQWAGWWVAAVLAYRYGRAVARWARAERAAAGGGANEAGERVFAASPVTVTTDRNVATWLEGVPWRRIPGGVVVSGAEVGTGGVRAVVDTAPDRRGGYYYWTVWDDARPVGAQLVATGEADTNEHARHAAAANMAVYIAGKR